MRLVNHASIASDICAYLDYVPVGGSFHPQCLASVPVPVGPYIELAAPMNWFGGMFSGAHKFTSTVYHSTERIALQAHDIGPLLPHIPIPPIDTLAPKHIVASSRKAVFYAGEVLANGKGIAACTFFDLAILPTPMNPCSLIPAPMYGTGTAVLSNSLLVGMHPISWIAGVAELWVSAVLNLLAAAYAQPDLELASGFGLETVLGKTPLQNILMSAASDGASSLVGALIRKAGQVHADYQGAYGVDLSVSIGAFKSGVAFEQNADGSGSAQYSYGVQNEFLGYGQSDKVSMNAQGEQTIEHQAGLTGGSHVGAFSSGVTDRSTYDQSGNLREHDVITNQAAPSLGSETYQSEQHRRTTHPASNPHDGVLEL